MVWTRKTQYVWRARVDVFESPSWGYEVLTVLDFHCYLSNSCHAQSLLWNVVLVDVHPLLRRRRALTRVEINIVVGHLATKLIQHPILWVLLPIPVCRHPLYNEVFRPFNMFIISCFSSEQDYMIVGERLCSVFPAARWSSNSSHFAPDVSNNYSVLIKIMVEVTFWPY